MVLGCVFLKDQQRRGWSSCGVVAWLFLDAIMTVRAEILMMLTVLVHFLRNFGEVVVTSRLVVVTLFILSIGNKNNR
jgi:hypothetical protein